MRKRDISAWIQKELEDHPDVTSIELAEKYRIPLQIIEIFKNKLIKGGHITPHEEHK